LNYYERNRDLIDKCSQFEIFLSKIAGMQKAMFRDKQKMSAKAMPQLKMLIGDFSNFIGKQKMESLEDLNLFFSITE